MNQVEVCTLRKNLQNLN